MSDTQFDLIVIGGGPAGYTGAIRASQLGFKVACIEKEKPLGGTCLNIGCIPSKALLDSSEHYHYAKTKLPKHGVMVGDVKLDLEAMMKRKDSVVRQLTNGIDGLFKKHKITRFTGKGKLVDGKSAQKTVQVEGGPLLSAPRVMLATGSVPSELPFLPFDGKRVISSTEALALPKVPGRMVVIGGGVIGLELGSVWMRLGAKVTVVEFAERICPTMDAQMSKELQKSLIKQGMEFLTATKCLGAKEAKGTMVVDVEDLATQKKAQLECDVILVSTGRKPFSAGLGLEENGIPKDKLGRVVVDAHFQTNCPGVFAVGDLIDGPMLAHKAEEDAIACVELMAGQAGHVDYNLIPGVIYTWPELANVGLTEEQCKERGINYKVGTFPFLANGRAKAMDETDGLVKIICDKATDKILGAHILGPWASDLIPEIVSVMEFGGAADDIARTCHAHPTLAEAVKEAALAANNRTLNY